MQIKRTIAYVLMCITFLLNVIPLIPHHHHNNDITSICLMAEAIEHPCSPNYNLTNKTPFSNKYCPDCCTTNIIPFNKNSSSSQINNYFLHNQLAGTPTYNVYNFTTPCTVLKSKNRPYYTVKYSSLTPPNHGLRAPPAFFII